MDFIRQYHWEYGTSSIKFNNEQFELTGCKVLTNDDTSLKYGYIRVTIRLSREMIGKMKKNLRKTLMKYSSKWVLTR